MTLVLDILELRNEIGALARARDLLRRDGRDFAEVQALLEAKRLELIHLKLRG